MVKDNLSYQIEKYLHIRKVLNRWTGMVFTMIFLVFLTTTYVLIMPAVTASGTAYCGMTEHTHGEECQGLQLICEIEEEEHIHETTCYEAFLSCDISVHIHSTICYSNRNADIETAEDWEKTLPEELTGDWAADVLAVADSQLGYQESSNNYIVTDEGKIKGYTRYGDWYGDAYGHWCAMFVSFCLHYAQVDRELMPQDANCQNWIQTLSKEEYSLYHEAQEYEPNSGDLIFFNWDEDTASDHVGIVVEILEESGQDEVIKQIKTIEGNTSDDDVRYRYYDIDDNNIMGYGQLPQNPEYNILEYSVIPYEEEPIALQNEEPAVMSIERPAESTMAVYANDAYAPDAISLTGSWSADVAAVANSQINYSEADGISKIDLWAGGDGTNAWNVNFVNYCMYYAGIDKASVPWDETYDLNTFKNQLEQRGMLKSLGETGLSIGDIVFSTTNWSSQELVVGIVTSHNPDSGIYRISFGDKDNSGSVVTEDYYADWYSRIMGVLRLSGKTVFSTGEIEIEATHNCGDDIAAIEFVLEDNNGNASAWKNQVKESIETDSTVVLANHFFSILFKDSEGESFIPAGITELTIDFQDGLSAELPEEVPGSNVKWVYRIIEEDFSVRTPDYPATTYTDINQNIKKIKMRYEDAYVFSFTSVHTDYSDLTSVNVSNLEELRNAVENNSFESVEILLMADIDATDLEKTISIGANKNIVLDLNGHVIRTGTTLFTVDGGIFTIKDTLAAAEESIVNLGPVILEADKDYDEEKENDMVGRTASYDGQTKQLTYYVTETEIRNHNTGATTESLMEHTVMLSGMIDGSAGSQPAICINSGSMNMNSGAITGCNDCGIYQTGGMIYINGGYICGNRSSGSGGGIHSRGDGSICIKAGVLAANEAEVDGGGIYTEADSLYLYGGIISGNVCSTSGSGGGIFSRSDTSIQMTGGYITNNRCNSDSYDAGGGGICMVGQSVLDMSGGYITGNYVGGGGGGIRTSANSMYMTGGFVNSNYADTAEGGGISAGTPCAVTITGGHINNNVTNTHEHWGGGGLFCANGDNAQGTYASFYITNVLITENNAGGYGGGVAGCSTGRTYICAKEGGAIFDNTASEPGKSHLSGGTSWKSEDHTYATETFLQYGYEDYFSAFNSIVGGTMLGDSEANWTGTVDGIPVQTQKDDTLISSYFMGLNSNPNTTGKQAAQKMAQVFINGNDSFTHGGGVLCNGYLIMGEIKQAEVYSRLKIHATKALQSAGGEAPALEAGQFKFELMNTDTSMIVATGENNETGDIIFDQMIPFTEEGIYTYRLYEKQDEGSRGVIMDTTEYEIKVTVKCFDHGLVQGNVKKLRYEISNLKVERINSSGRERLRDYDPDDMDSLPVELHVSDDISFTNVISDGTNISVHKIWEGEAPQQGTRIQVQLYRNEEPYGAFVELSEENGWQYDWGELPLSETIEGVEYKYTYSVAELNVPEGYRAEYSMKSGSSKNTYWVPYTGDQLIDGNEYILLSPDKGYVFAPGTINSNVTTADRIEVNITEGTITDENGNLYEEYLSTESVTENAIFYSGRTGWNEVALRHKNLEGNPGIVFDVSAYSAGSQIDEFDIQMRTDRFFHMYLGNTKIGSSCFDGSSWHEFHNRTFALVYNNNRFSIVYQEAAQESQKPYLYTAVHSVGKVGITFEITNKAITEEEQTYTIDITKKSAGDTNLLLAGAHFELYYADSDGNLILNQDSPAAVTFYKTAAGRYQYCGLEEGENGTDVMTDTVTVFGGKLVLSDLPPGNYILRETLAPNGYEPIEDIKIIFDGSSKTTVQLELLDSLQEEDGFFLPETGGAGTDRYIYGGMLLSFAAMILLYIKFRNRAKGLSPDSEK